MVRQLSRIVVACLTAVMVVAAAGASRAASLVEGGYLSEGLGVAPQRAEAAPGDLDLGGLTLSFTPRGPFGASAGSRGPDLPTLRLNLSGGDVDRVRLGGLDLAVPQTSRGGAGADSTSFEIGGAFEWQSWSLGGSYVEIPDIDGDTRLLGATVGYGRIGARLAYGQTERAADAGDREFWLFSTNLAARSWLSLEGDVGYMPRQDTEPSSAVGRVGLRLRF